MRMRIRVATGLAAALLPAVACVEVTALDFPADAVPLDVPAQYAYWWEMTERCSGLDGDLTDVAWFYVPGADVLRIGEYEAQGYFGWDNRIVIAEGSLTKGRLVRHEMLHALGARGHSREYFGHRCEGIVVCDGDCGAEIGPGPAVADNARLIEPSELALTSVIEPEPLSRTAYDGWYVATVGVTNTFAEPVRVRLERLAPDHGAAALFGFQINGNGPEYTWTYDEYLMLAPFETRRFAFDLNSQGRKGFGLRPGPNALRTFFNTATARTHELLVNP